MCGSSAGAPRSNSTCTWPASRSLTDGAVPLYGMCRNEVPVCSLRYSIVMCAALPLPPKPYGQLAGTCSLASAISSASVRAGTEAWTTSRFGTRATQATGAKLRSGS